MAGYLIVPKKRLPRKPPRHVQILNQRHARQIGEITLAWNNLQADLYEIFAALVADKNHDLAHGLWHSIQSDKTQRDMLKSVARAVLSQRKRLLANIEWIIKKAEMLSPFRNDAAHTAMSFHTGRFAPNPHASRKQSLDRLYLKPVSVNWRKVRGDLYVLGSFAKWMWAEVADPGSVATWPHRPQLNTKPIDIPRQTPPRQPRKKRKRPPPTSQT